MRSFKCKVHATKVQKVTEYNSSWCVHTACMGADLKYGKKNLLLNLEKEIKTNVARGSLLHVIGIHVVWTTMTSYRAVVLGEERDEQERGGEVVHSSGLINLSSFCSCWLCSIRGKYQHSSLLVFHFYRFFYGVRIDVHMYLVVWLLWREILFLVISWF